MFENFLRGGKCACLADIAVIQKMLGYRSFGPITLISCSSISKGSYYSYIQQLVWLVFQKFYQQKDIILFSFFFFIRNKF